MQHDTFIPLAISRQENGSVILGVCVELGAFAHSSFGTAVPYFPRRIAHMRRLIWGFAVKVCVAFPGASGRARRDCSTPRSLSSQLHRCVCTKEQRPIPTRRAAIGLVSHEVIGLSVLPRARLLGRKADRSFLQQRRHHASLRCLLLPWRNSRQPCLFARSDYANNAGHGAEDAGGGYN